MSVRIHAPGHGVIHTDFLGEMQTVSFLGYIETTFHGDMYSGVLGEILCG